MLDSTGIRLHVTLLTMHFLTFPPTATCSIRMTPLQSGHQSFRTVAIVVAVALALCLPCSATATDGPRLIELRIGKESYAGRLLSRSGNHVWLMDSFGTIQQLPVDRISSMQVISETFRLAKVSDHIHKLKAELPSSYTIITTQHCIVAAPDDSAILYGEELEQLFLEMHTCFQQLGFKPESPELPLTAIVFPDSELFRHYCNRDQMKWSEDLSGYYSIKSNRIVVLNRETELRNPIPSERTLLTSVPADNRNSEQSPPKDRHSTLTRTTLKHEACHQIGFNCGIHSRTAQRPQWLVEGIALYLESDAARKRGKQPIAAAECINHERLQWFNEQYLPRHQPGDIAGIIASDDHFSRQALDAYSLAWAFTCFLCSNEQPELRQNFARYVRQTARQSAPEAGTAEQRLQLFRSIVGDPDLLEIQLLRFMQDPELSASAAD